MEEKRVVAILGQAESCGAVNGVTYSVFHHSNTPGGRQKVLRVVHSDIAKLRGLSEA